MNREAEPPAPMKVWYSNHLEQLADQLIENLGATKDSPASLLFAMPTIIVPNRNIETYLKYEIARGTGIAAGLKFQMSEQFLEDLLRQTKVEPLPKLVKANALRAFFIDVLSPDPGAVPGLPDAVRTYLAAGGDTDARDLRRFQLGSRLAGLARQYGNYRPEWLKAGAAGEAALDGGPMAGTEQWQRDIWARLIEHVLAAGKRAPTGFALRIVRFACPDQFRGDQRGPFIRGSYVSGTVATCIRELNQYSILSIYTLGPSIEFPEDLPLHAAKAGAVGRRSRRRVKASSDSRSAEAPSPDELSIVDQWGRPGREYFRTLAQVPGAIFQPTFMPINQSTVLGRLQDEILERAVEGDAPLGAR